MLWWHVLLLMFAALAFLMASGMPIFVAFGILNVALFYFFAGGEGALQAVALSSYGSVATFAFTALPMFIVMGEVILHSGLAKLAIDAIGKWLGRMPGRLAVLAVLGGTVFGAASGSSMASAAMLGRVLIPEMRRRGYDKGLAVAMRHVRPEYHVVLSDKVDNLGQENIVRFRAEKKIPFTHVFHRR